MILKDIADMTGLDISTISRVVNSKYIQTHFGIYALKYFFSEGMQTESGEEVSTREIKKILQDCIVKEDKVIVINNLKPIEYQSKTIAEGLANYGLSNHYLVPAVRTFIEEKLNINV